MDRSSWYLVAYDIADATRLRRVHAQLRRTGLPAQHSVFFVQRSERGIKQLVSELDQLLHSREDDLRAYPIRHPGEVWFVGAGTLDGSLILTGDAPARRAKVIAKPKRGRMAWLFRRDGAG